MTLTATRPAMGSVVLGLVLAALLPRVASAQSTAVGRAIRAADWATAQALAGRAADPVAGKLVTYFRLAHQGDGGAAEIAAFMAANPDWPGQATLLKRRDEALANEADAATVLRLCTGPAPPQSGAALARCADAAASPEGSAAAAGRAWVAGLPDADSAARFLQRWGSVLTPADEALRFAALLGPDPAAAAAQLARLAPLDRKVARVRLAIRTNEADAGALFAALPPAARSPVLVLEQARALRRADHDAAALALWRDGGFAAEHAAGAPAGFWPERSALARKRLAAGDNAGAYALADDAAQPDADGAADAAFLAGFIALRRLHRPELAAAQFSRLARTTSAISQARAHYWLARTAAARGDAAAAHDDFAAAAAWPTTYYGQLAAAALGETSAALNARIGALSDPAWSQPQALDFAGLELTRAAVTLVAWGEPGRARAFLQLVAATRTDPARRSMAARFALDLGMPDQAVAVARRAGRDGVVLVQSGWPLAATPPERPVEAAVALGIIRQESSFDIGAVSPSGARGLMQLMPPTAASVGRQIGAAIPVDALTTDAAGNMRLGTAYLGQLIRQFGGSLPLAIAAYNAGPNRVGQWLAEDGDPRGAGTEALIDWIEQIPFPETRNYVQRVIENVVVYRAKRHEARALPVAP